MHDLHLAGTLADEPFLRAIAMANALEDIEILAGDHGTGKA